MNGQAVVSGQMRYLLVVDSDWSDRFTLSMLLQRFGYTVASTSCAKEGVEYLCVAQAEAVFAEVGEAGTELIERLKKDARFQDVPIIIVSKSHDLGMEARLQRGELAGLLRTPVDPNEVYRVVQKVIEKGRRSNIRIETAIKAVLHDGPGRRDGFVTVLSQLGMFFRTLDPLPVNAQVAVDVSLWDRSVRVEAEVLYVVTFEEGPFCEPGMGMKFLKIEAQGSSLIKAFIDEQIGMGPSGQA